MTFQEKQQCFELLNSMGIEHAKLLSILKESFEDEKIEEEFQSRAIGNKYICCICNKKPNIKENIMFNEQYVIIYCYDCNYRTQFSRIDWDEIKECKNLIK